MARWAQPRYLWPLTIHPLDRLRFEFHIHGTARVGAAAAFQTADNADGHVLLNGDLARKSNTRRGDILGGQDIFLRLGHARGLAVEELDAAGRAFRLASAGMKLVNASVFG